MNVDVFARQPLPDDGARRRIDDLYHRAADHDFPHRARLIQVPRKRYPPQPVPSSLSAKFLAKIAEYETRASGSSAGATQPAATTASAASALHGLALSDVVARQLPRVAQESGGVGQRPHRNRSVVGGHAAEFRAGHLAVRAADLGARTSRREARQAGAMAATTPADPAPITMTSGTGDSSSAFTTRFRSARRRRIRGSRRRKARARPGPRSRHSSLPR